MGENGGIYASLRKTIAPKEAISLTVKETIAASLKIGSGAVEEENGKK